MANKNSKSVPNRTSYIRMQNFLLFVASMLSWVVPKKRGSIAFLSLHSPTVFSDNLKALFEENKSENILDSISNIILAEVIWRGGLSLDRFVMSGRYIWSVVRAEYIVVDSDRVFLAIGRFSFIQVWHGTGFKNIGYLNPMFSKVKRKLIKRFGQMTHLTVASSEPDRIRKEKSLCARETRVLGSPRLDILVREARIGESPENLNILYAPTFRSKQNKPPLLKCHDSLKQLDALLVSKRAYLHVKLHPIDQGACDFSNFKNILFCEDSSASVHEIMSSMDVMISDYSGVVTDFSILRRPILWYIPDISDYASDSRDFYYDFLETIPGPVCLDIEDLMSKIEDMDWFSEPEYAEDFESFVSMFHSYPDGNSSRRVLNAIRDIVYT